MEIMILLVLAILAMWFVSNKMKEGRNKIVYGVIGKNMYEIYKSCVQKTINNIQGDEERLKATIKIIRSAVYNINNPDSRCWKINHWGDMLLEDNNWYGDVDGCLSSEIKIHCDNANIYNLDEYTAEVEKDLACKNIERSLILH